MHSVGDAYKYRQAERVQKAAMTQDEERIAVAAICDSRSSAEAAVVTLHREGLDMKRLSIGDKTPSAAQHVRDSVKDGQFLVLVLGTAEMIVHARAVLGTTSSSEFLTRVDNADSRIAADLGTD